MYTMCMERERETIRPNSLERSSSTLEVRQRKEISRTREVSLWFLEQELHSVRKEKEMAEKLVRSASAKIKEGKDMQERAVHIEDYQVRLKRSTEGGKLVQAGAKQKAEAKKQIEECRNKLAELLKQSRDLKQTGQGQDEVTPPWSQRGYGTVSSTRERIISPHRENELRRSSSRAGSCISNNRSSVASSSVYGTANSDLDFASDRGSQETLRGTNEGTEDTVLFKNGTQTREMAAAPDLIRSTSPVHEVEQLAGSVDPNAGRAASNASSVGDSASAQGLYPDPNINCSPPPDYSEPQFAYAETTAAAEVPSPKPNQVFVQVNQCEINNHHTTIEGRDRRALRCCRCFRPILKCVAYLVNGVYECFMGFLVFTYDFF